MLYAAVLGLGGWGSDLRGYRIATALSSFITA